MHTMDNAFTLPDLDLSTFLPPLPSPTQSEDFPISPVPEAVDPSLLNLAVLQSLFFQQQPQHPVAPLASPPPPQHDDLDQFVKFEQQDQQQQQEAPSCAEASKQQPQQRPARQLECFNCHVTKTPLWRRTPDRAHSLCNACGLYYKQYGTHRPLHIRQKMPNKKLQQQQLQQQQQQQQLVATVAANLLRPLLQTRCASCYQTHTPLWRKNDRGEPVCNSCDLYASKLLGQKRARDWDTGAEEGSNKKQAFSELDDTRFKGLLSRMNKEQMHGFLEMLERRCAILRNVLFEEEQCS